MIQDLKEQIVRIDNLNIKLGDTDLCDWEYIGGSRGGVPGVGTSPFFRDFNAFKWGHIFGTPPLFMVENHSFCESFLCFREKDQFHELISKHMHRGKFKEKKYMCYELEWEVFKAKNTIMSMIKKEKTRQDYETLSQICIFFLHVLNDDASWHQTCVLWNEEELTCLLSDSLSMLPKRIFDQVFEHFLVQVEMRTLRVNFSVKMDLLFKLCWCRRLINEGYADDNIVSRCINNFYKENKIGFTVEIFSITDASEKSFRKLLLYCLRKKVTSKATAEHVNERCEYRKSKSAYNNGKDLIYAHCASILIGNKMKNVDIKQYVRKLNIKGPEDENEVEMQSQQVNLLILLILLLLVTTLGHKSAKLKKYLALKYEYDMASLYLLWCSGDIEVHPGPSRRREQLDYMEYKSEQKRKWLQDINSILLKLYWEKINPSIEMNIWQTRPYNWPENKPFYDTKNVSKNSKKDMIANKLTDEDIFDCLLECLEKANVVIPQAIQSEISAWKNKNIKLLHILQVFRIEMEKVESAILNLYLSNLVDDVVKNLQGIKVNIKNSNLDPKKIADLLQNDKRQKKPAELVAHITRDLASKLCKLVRTNESNKIWNYPPPTHWPEDVPFFNPCNRGSYEKKDKCSDRKLVDTFLNLQDLKIPQNLQVLVDTYQMMCKSKDNEEKKNNQEKLCRLYTMQSNVEKLDFAIQHLYKKNLFLRGVCALLKQFWTTQSDEDSEDVLNGVIVRSNDRPYTTITLATNFEPDADLRNVSYTIPIKDAYLQIKCTEVLPNEPGQQQALTGSFTTANNPENFEDSALPLYINDCQSTYDFGNQTDFQNNNSDSEMDEENGHKTFNLEKKGKTLSVTHQYQRSHNDLESLTTHNTLSSDLDCTRCYTEYNTNLQVCESVNISTGSPGENIHSSISTSKVKRKQLDDKEEPVKKLLKTKANQFGHYNSTDEEISSPESKNDEVSQEPNHISTSNQHDIYSANVQDLPSLEFSLSDIIDSIGDNCNSKSSEDSQTFQQTCDLESMNNSNQQDSLENIIELNYIDNQMKDQTDDKTELEKCLEMIKYLSR